VSAPVVPRLRPAVPDERDAWVLVQAAQGGDAEAFGALYDRYFDFVYRFAYRRVGSHQLAEDITSETFAKALKGIRRFRWEGRDPGAWLVTIARNLTADHFKSAQYRYEVAAGDVAARYDRVDAFAVDTEQAAIDHFADVDLMRAVSALIPRQRECIMLRFFEGLSVAETARVMDINDSAIKALQFRAVRSLAKLLRDEANPW
jgi:RNA polymerase sigma-70 factor (ECF subfamily)